MPVGRPTKLTPALIKQAKKFVADRRADRMLLPTVEGLALELGISRETVYAWCEAGTLKGGDNADPDPLQIEFSDIVRDLQAAQGEKLMQYSLAGKYNPTIAKLILSGKHGYVEKQSTDLTTNGKDLPSPILGGQTKEVKDDRS
jgi:hypothetical protein